MLRLPIRPLSRPYPPHLFCARRHSQYPPSSWRAASPATDSGNFEKPSIFPFDYFRRVVKYSLVCIFTLSMTTWAAFEGTHLWVEKVELAVENDEELQKWEWVREAERWSGGAVGGTDPALGFKARHAIRGAWIAQHWGTGSDAISVDPRNAAKSSAGDVHAGVQAGLKYAHDFLNIALTSAMDKAHSPNLRSQTIQELLSRHADILERIGTENALSDARSRYERVWASSSARDLDAARTALKIGNLSSRIGDEEDAVAWWSRTLFLVNNQHQQRSIDPQPILPESMPLSPLAQRTLASVLTSLSSHYARTGQLQRARAVEESGLTLLKGVQLPAKSLPPQSLHALFVLHRSALLSIHLAEVLFALGDDTKLSIAHLQNAADASEKVALILSGLPLTHPDVPQSAIPHPPSSAAPLLPAFSKSRTMRKPASSLLWAARRSAAEAWNLSGLLNEGDDKGGSPEKALECYERALGWAGAAADYHGGISGAGDGILDEDWRVLWTNYIRVREIVQQKGKI